MREADNPSPPAQRRVRRVRLTPSLGVRQHGNATPPLVPLRALVVAGLFAVVAALLFGWANASSQAEKSNVAGDLSVETAGGKEAAAPLVEPEPEPEPAPVEPIEFTMVFGGDMLIHMPVADSAWGMGGEWDFVPLMDPIAPYIAGSDLAICHMETPMVAPGGTPSGYPMFAAPSELAANMAEVGWDGCSTASNHSLDRGFDGIGDSLDLLDKAGLGHNGTARTEEEAGKPQFYELEADGHHVTVAHLAAAYDTNGIPLPEDAPWSWSEIDTGGLIDEAKQAREDGADLVIVSAHCCQVEYTTDPEPYQVEIAEALADSGEVDLLVSHHAHVPKTIEMLPGGPTGDGMWVAWGLGNFISNQSVDCCRAETSTGLLAFFTFEQIGDEHPVVTEASWLGATMDFTTGHRVRPLLASGLEGGNMDPSEASYRHDLLTEIMDGTPAVEREAPPAGNSTVTVVPRA